MSETQLLRRPSWPLGKRVWVHVGGWVIWVGICPVKYEERGIWTLGLELMSSPAKKQKETSQKEASYSSRLFASIIQPPHATLFCKWSSWSPITEVLKRGFAGRGQTRSHTCPISKTSASSDFQKTVQSSWDRSLQINKSLYDILQVWTLFTVNIYCIQSETSAFLRFPKNCTVLRQKLTENKTWNP